MISSSSRSVPAREDCWSEEATFTLIEAWGQRFIELNRGNLRQKQWQEVADAVNSRHGHVKKARRTDVQCKNRIDTLKKKYKIEKVRKDESSSFFRKNYSAIAAAAAAAAESEEEDEEDEEEEHEEEVSGESSEANGIRKLARVIEKFGQVYAKVEAEKQKQMIELEKQGCNLLRNWNVKGCKCLLKCRFNWRRLSVLKDLTQTVRLLLSCSCFIS
ncbi:Trihelix transcription factor ASIL2 [Bienertia sinuspersici]